MDCTRPILVLDRARMAQLERSPTVMLLAGFSRSGRQLRSASQTPMDFLEPLNTPPCYDFHIHFSTVMADTERRCRRETRQRPLIVECVGKSNIQSDIFSSGHGCV